MIYLSTLLYYVFFASAILIYGIGLNKTVKFNFFTKEKRQLNYFIKIIFTIFISSILSYIVIDNLLSPLKLTELYPLTSFFIFVFVSLILEAILRAATGRNTTEFIFTFLIVLLSVSESSSLLNTIIIDIGCLLSIAILIPIFFSFKKMNLSNEDDDKIYLPRIFLFIAILVVLISVFDITWLNQEVIR